MCIRDRYQDYLTQILPLAEQLSETYDADEMEQKGQEFAKQWEKYRKLLAVFMENELFSDLLMPDGDLESMVIQMQWIAMEMCIRDRDWMKARQKQ